eukprot:SAG25_NODE_220_length_11624_cov_41.246508_4_plen_348_part_00
MRDSAVTGETETETETDSWFETDETDTEEAVEMLDTGSIRCAFQVTTTQDFHNNQAMHASQQWQAYKDAMHRQPVVVRLYVLDGIDLRAMSGNSCSAYLVASLGNQTISRRNTAIKKTLSSGDAIGWREYFEFETVLPSAATLTVTVKHLQLFGKDKDIGMTQIDLERRYFCEDWLKMKLHPVESRQLTAVSEAHAKRVGPSNHGTVRLWLDILQKTSVPLPLPVNIQKPPKEHFQLRVIVWEAENIPVQGLTKQNDMFVSTHLNLKGEKEQKKTTDTHWRAKDGRGNFNHRMIFAVNVEPRLPVKRCALTLKVWDKEPLRLTNKLLGYREVNLGSLVTDALTQRLR